MTISRFRSIRFRLTVWFIGVLALVILAVSAILYFGLERALLQSVDANLRAVALRSVMPTSDDNSRSGSRRDREEHEDEDEHEQLRQLMLLSNTPARLLTLDGSPLQSDPLFPRGITVTQPMLGTADTGSARYETVYVGSAAYRLYTAPIRIEETRVAIVQVAAALDEQFQTLADLRTLLAWLIPLSLLFAAIGGSFLAGRALAPAERVRRDVKKIIDQADLSHRVSEGLPDDEVGQLARTFDELLERIQQAMQRERRFTSDASHELRTPLTVLKGEISVALSRPRDAREYRDTLAQLESTVDDMSQMVEDLLMLTRAASGRQPPAQSAVNIAELVRQVCERLQVIAAERGLMLSVQTTSDARCVVLGDRIQLQRVFTNLVDNALRYTPRGGRVDVTAQHTNTGHIAVEVRDTGRGIAPEHLPNLFQRFYRADSGRARESGGTGLGLAIAQAIVRAHGGQITATSQVGEGSCFTVTLPASGETDTAMIDSNKLTTVPPLSTPHLTAHSPAPVPHPLSPTLHERSFRAMNTDIQLLLRSDDARRANCVLDAAEWFLLQVDWRLSRFRDSSELSILNRQGHTHASRMLLDVLQLAAQAYADTSGLFNPLIGPALVAAGYDRSFDDIGTDHDVGRAVSPPPSPMRDRDTGWIASPPSDPSATTGLTDSTPDTLADEGRADSTRDASADDGRAESRPYTSMDDGQADSTRDALADDGRADSPPYIPAFDQCVDIDAASGRVSLCNGAQLDLGGIAKGWAIDRAFRALSRLGPCCVNAGGDVRASGSFDADGQGWRVDIADPFAPETAPEPVRSVMLRDRAIATSGIMKRRWRMNGVEQHHLIDPRTAQPAYNELLFVTVIADSAVQAEVAAKTAFILGAEAGSAWLDARRLPALIMFRNGESVCNEWFPHPGPTAQARTKVEHGDSVQRTD